MAEVKIISKEDQKRKDALIKTLTKAKEQADTARLYLIANDRNLDDIYAAADVADHIDNALERLGAHVPS